MKREARILVSACSGDTCLGVVLRSIDIDGAVAGRSCEDLCRRLEESGYSGELRYAYGSCRCGLPSPPRAGGRLEAAYRALLAIASSVGRDRLKAPAH